MKPTLLYARIHGEEIDRPSARELSLLSRRDFVRRGTLFLPLSFFAGSLLSAKASSTIVNRTIASASQNAIQMLNGTWARPLVLPATWSKIRFGCRLHWSNIAANLTGGALFSQGFCSGTSNQYGDSSTLNWIGVGHDAATWTYTANAGAPLYQLSSNPVARTRIGTTNTDAALTTSWNEQLSCGVPATGGVTNLADRQMLFVDLFKGSPNYTVHLPFWTNSGGGVVSNFDMSSANFLVFMQQLSPSPGSPYGANNLQDQALAFSEATNPLNAINIYWNRPDNYPEICDVAVAVLA